MSLLFRRRESPEARAVTSVPWSLPDGWSDSCDKALRLAPVYSAVSLITDALVTLPWHAYRGGGATRTPMASDPALVRDPSGGVVDVATWRSQYVASMLLRGNAYGFAVPSGGRLVWLNPDRVTVKGGITKAPTYAYDGQEITPDRGTIVHVRGLTMPGEAVALSPISLFRRQLEVGQATVDYARTWFRRGGVPSALLSNTSKTLSAGEAQTVKSRFVESVQAGEPLVVGSDWKYDALSVSPKDAQFIQTAQLTANTIASIFHVAPEEIGGTAGSSLTYSTLEMNEIKFIRHAVMPWTARLEQAISALLPSPQYVRFNLDAYVRADLMTRMQAHEIATRIGVETQDEARALEDKPPLTDAERLAWSGQSAAEDPARNLTDMVQKIYLGVVNNVITRDEAREILNRAGADLPITGGATNAAG